MFKFIQKLLFGGQKVNDLNITLMLIGLDNAGKSTLLSALQGSTCLCVRIVQDKMQLYLIFANLTTLRARRC